MGFRLSGVSPTRVCVLVRFGMSGFDRPRPRSSGLGLSGLGLSGLGLSGLESSGFPLSDSAFFFVAVYAGSSIRGLVGACLGSGIEVDRANRIAPIK